MSPRSMRTVPLGRSRAVAQLSPSSSLRRSPSAGPAGSVPAHRCSAIAPRNVCSCSSVHALISRTAVRFGDARGMPTVRPGYGAGRPSRRHRPARPGPSEDDDAATAVVSVGREALSQRATSSRVSRSTRIEPRSRRMWLPPTRTRPRLVRDVDGAGHARSTSAPTVPWSVPKSPGSVEAETSARSAARRDVNVPSWRGRARRSRCRCRRRGPPTTRCCRTVGRPVAFHAIATPRLIHR